MSSTPRAISDRKIFSGGMKFEVANKFKIAENRENLRLGGGKTVIGRLPYWGMMKSGLNRKLGNILELTSHGRCPRAPKKPVIPCFFF